MLCANAAETQHGDEFFKDIIFFLAVGEQEMPAMCMHFVVCTFDLNVLQGLSKYPRHDVRKPYHLHDDLQRERERERQKQRRQSVRQHLPDSENGAAEFSLLQTFRGIEEHNSCYSQLVVNKLYCGQIRALCFDSPPPPSVL